MTLSKPHPSHISSVPPPGVELAPRRYPRIRWRDASSDNEIVLRTPLVVGSARSADVVLLDPTVSRIHAELDPREDGLWIRDLDSRNGTFVDGVRVAECSIRCDAELRLGAMVLDVEYDAGIVAPVELWATPGFQRLVGRSAVMRELFALLARVSRTDASVLVRGETGTGKELVARSIHDASHRRNGPYVVVDCAALPENLLEAELFGHAKGAFTGAVNARVGAIEAAHDGTVFLDEIGEVPLAMQPKLLRALEQRTVRRIGETEHRPVNVRFVTATHRDLLAMVARGEFREDLYFRLCVIPVQVPPLRSRREDIELLVERFLDGRRMSPRLLDEIKGLPWRGNVRELRNFVERANALGEDEVLRRSPALVTSIRFDEERPPSSGRVSARVPSLVESDDEGGGTAATPGGADGVQKLDAMRESEPEIPAPPSSRGLSSLQPPPSKQRIGASAPEAARLGVPFSGSFKIFRERWMELGEREFLRLMLERHARNVASLSREADVDRTYVYRLVRKYGL